MSFWSRRGGFRRDFGDTCADSRPTLRRPLYSMRSEARTRWRRRKQERLRRSASCRLRGSNSTVRAGVWAVTTCFGSICRRKLVSEEEESEEEDSSTPEPLLCFSTQAPCRSAARPSSSPSSSRRPSVWWARCDRDDTRSRPASSGTWRRRTPSACLRLREKVQLVWGFMFKHCGSVW